MLPFREAWRERGARFACVVLATLWWYAPFASGPFTGWGDWQYFHHMWEAGRVALERHGEWPTWDPFHCGGVTLWGNPQAQVFSPQFYLSLLVGTTLALKLHVWLHAVLGALGAYAFARSEGRLQRVPALVAAASFSGAGYFAWHLAGGHSAFAPFYFAPLLLLWWRRSAEDLRYAAGVALLMALTLFGGGVYPFPYFVLLLAFDVLIRLRLRRLPRLVLAGLVAATLAALMGAARLVPILARLDARPRHTPLLDALTPGQLVQTLLYGEAPAGWQSRYGWPEYGAYLGPIALALACIGLLWALRRRPGWLLGVVVFGGLALGDHGPASPWPLLHRLPVYDSLRVPSRFLVFVTLYVSLLAGAGAQLLVDIARRFAHPGGRARVPGFVAIGALGVALQLFLVNAAGVNDRWESPPITLEPPAERYHLTTRPYIEEYAHFPQRNIGTRWCYDPMNVRVAPGLWTGDRAQVRVPEGTLHAGGRSVTRVWAEVEQPSPGPVHFNQNYAPGWRSDVGEVDAESRRLTVNVPAGRHRVTVRFYPPGWAQAWGLSALGAGLGLLLVLGLGWRRRASRRRLLPMGVL